MQVMAIEQTPSVQTMERLWWDWLLKLKPWELHVLRERELIWHDDFVAGIVTLDELSCVLDLHFGEDRYPPHSQSEAV